MSGDAVAASVRGGMASRRTEHVNASLQNFITDRPTDRPRPADRATTEERTTPTAQGAREAIHNNVDHEMIKRFLVCVRPRARAQGTN